MVSEKHQRFQKAKSERMEATNKKANERKNERKTDEEGNPQIM